MTQWKIHKTLYVRYHSEIDYKLGIRFDGRYEKTVSALNEHVNSNNFIRNVSL